MRPADPLISGAYMHAAFLFISHSCCMHAAGAHSKVFNYVPQHKETCFESIETLIIPPADSVLHVN